MSVDQRLIDALAPLGIPVVPDPYTGEETSYCVFYYSTQPDAFGDDVPGCERYLIQVHLHCPGGMNTLELRREIKERLFQAGFTWPGEVNAAASARDGEQPGQTQHFAFACESAEGIWDGEAQAVGQT